MRIIDSSVIVKFFSKEPGWRSVKKYLLKPYTLELAVKELGNALWKKALKGEVSFKDAVEIIRGFKLIARFIKQDAVIERAFELALKYRITLYDSLFIAAAEKTGATLVTCDSKQAEVARLLGLQVEQPE